MVCRKMTWEKIKDTKVLRWTFSAKVDLAESKGSFSDKSLKERFEDLPIVSSDTLDL